MPLTDLGAKFHKILVYGQTGTGKTFGILHIAASLKNNTLFYLDTDEGTSKDVDEFPDDVKSRLQYYLATSMDEMIADLNDATLKCMPGDWIVVDMAARVWDLAQSEFIRKVFDASEVGRYYLEMRRELERHPVITKSGGVDKQPNLDGWTDWVPIKKRHNEDFMDVLKMLPRKKGVHVLVTTSADQLKTQGKFADKGDTISVFGKVGYKPEGEKHNPHRFDTILFLSKAGGEYYVTCLKNRGRKEFGQTLIPEGYSFFEVYLEESTVQKKLMTFVDG